MADEDEIDILGDFSFNSCFAQNNQGIPSCSNREDTVHPQWLLDSTETNWYDKQNKDNKRSRDVTARKLVGNSSSKKCHQDIHKSWSTAERKLLVKEMAKYGRNVLKISQTLKTKTAQEILVLIEAEYGVQLENSEFELVNHIEDGDIPAVIQEEVVTDNNVSKVLDMVKTGSPTIPVVQKTFRQKANLTKTKTNSFKRDILKSPELIAINPSEILYEDDLVIGSTESIGSDIDLSDIVSKNIAKYQAKRKTLTKIGNHRRKVVRNNDKIVQNRSKDMLKSPQRRQRKDSSLSLSDDTVKSPKMQIVLGSGQALPVSEGEQVIKIEKKKDSESDSEIEVDVDSGDDDIRKSSLTPQTTPVDEAPIAVPLTKFEPLPRRQKKINLDGGGGYTIMHTESGDLYAVGAEPKRERQTRKQPLQLIQCRLYNAQRPAPYEVRVHVSTLIAMDAHAHTSRAEVMGLLGGVAAQGGGAGSVTSLTLRAYRAAAAAAGSAHCDMDPVSQSMAAESLLFGGWCVCGWHHSHPSFPPSPSAVDLRSQRALQEALEWAHLPFLGFITSQHWPTGRTASQYRCIRVEDEDFSSDTPMGYQFSVKLVGDLDMENLAGYLQELRSVLLDDTNKNEYSVDMVKDICPQAGITYLEKCISSISHHMRSANYADDDPVVVKLIQGVRDIFR